MQVSVLKNVLLKGVPEKPIRGHHRSRQHEEGATEDSLGTERKPFCSPSNGFLREGTEWKQNIAPRLGQSFPPPTFLYWGMVRSG